jgi:antitoxin MazE
MQKITRWGNSAGVRLNAYLLREAGLSPGDYVAVRLLDSGDICLRPLRNRRAVEPVVERTTPKKDEW